MTNAPTPGPGKNPPPGPAPQSPPALTGRDINLAATATRRVLVSALVPFDVTFEQWTVINQVGSGGVTTEAAMAALLRTGLQLGEAEIEEQFAALAAADLVGRGREGSLGLTTRGQALFERGTAVVADIVAELYAGFAPDDLVRAHEILVEITARAEARLASVA